MSRPKGTLVAIGGAEDKKGDMDILRRVLEEADGKAERVEVLACASREPREAARPYLRAFDDLGIRHVDWLDVRNRREADERRSLERLEEADVIYFTGGDQLLLVDTLADTRALGVIRERYEQGAVIAGTSAGAAAMSATMLARGKADEGLTKGNTETQTGLSLLPQTVIDTHFLQRGRFARLLEIVSFEPELIGLGISEDTGIVVHDGHRFEVVGSDNVIVVDGRQIRHTDSEEVEEGENIGVVRAIVHALAEGYTYDLETRKALPPKASKKVSA